MINKVIRISILIGFLLIVLSKSFAFNLNNFYKVDSLILDQKTVNYIYNRALDIIIRHTNVLSFSNQEALFNYKIDTIFISPTLTKTTVNNPNEFDNHDLNKVETQIYFDQVTFLNTINILKSFYTLNREEDTNPNINISFSSIYQNDSMLYLDADLFWNGNNGKASNYSKVVISMEMCNNNQVFFRKLFTQVDHMISAPDKILVKNDSEVNEKYSDQQMHRKMTKFKNQEYPRIYFYEYDLNDKSCE